MNAPAQFLSPSEAAARLGVSAKALRLYEQRGLVRPLRSVAGWRAYGPNEMARMGEIVALRSLGLTVTQVKGLLTGDGAGLEDALGAHQLRLQDQLGKLAVAVDRVRTIRNENAQGRTITVDDLVPLARSTAEAATAFVLPWPWNGERFELFDIRPVNYIIGSLGSGKTVLAKRLAEIVPNALFLGLDRLEHGQAAALSLLAGDQALKKNVDQALQWLVDDGAETSDALVALLVGIIGTNAEMVVVDMVEEGLDQATQEALAAYFRLASIGKTLFLLTRSSSILDLQSVGLNEAIILCPPNHSVPKRVLPHSGASGYETVQNCLAPPDVRARVAGVIFFKPALINAASN